MLSVPTRVQMTMTKIRSYRELSRLETFDERYDYLRLGGGVGNQTFGYDRYLNQRFYTSYEWRNCRQHVIARDLGRNLGVEGYDINDRIYIHHMNPLTKEQVLDGDPSMFDPEFLISCTMDTHNAIHYGVDEHHRPLPVERRPGDTKLW